MKLGHPIITATDNLDTDTFDNNFIRLSLNKPKLWNWKLTTSKSSPNIIFPRIQLVDPSGTILAEATEAGCVFESKKCSKNSSYKSTNSAKSTTEASCLFDSSKSSKKSSYKSNNSKTSISNLNTLNIKNIEGTSASKVNSLQRKKTSQKINRERSDASINNRHSFRDDSSTESSEEEKTTLYSSKENSFARKPKYIYRTCSAGTLIVCEESFYKYKRRRPKGRKYKTKDDTIIKEVIEHECLDLNQNISKGISKSRSASSNLSSTYKKRDIGKDSVRESNLETYRKKCDNINEKSQEISFTPSYQNCDIKHDGIHNQRRSSSLYEKKNGMFQNKGKNVRKSASYGSLSRKASDMLKQQICQTTIETVSEEDIAVEDFTKAKRRQLRRKIVRKNTERPKPRDRLDLKLNHALWRGSDGGYDQGYGSERSPEEEYPPSMLGESSRRVATSSDDPHDIYPFITPECTFTVTVTKGPRGLGLSVSGGTDSRGVCPGLIRVKRLFPHQPAWATGKLAPGDLLLAANGCTLTGLSNYEALEVLRTAPATVTLTVCRPPGQNFDRQSPTPSEPPPPPRRVGSCGAGSGMSGTSSGMNSAEIPPPLSLLADGPYGEFDIVMRKRGGSLGFTLRREDNSILGHYVRALVREPALSDGRLRPGDRILAVNGVSMCQLSHEEAVAFLRRCGDEVTLKLYRDSAQTPVGAVSPTESEKNDCSARWRSFNGDSGGRSTVRTHLRQEALDMLYDLAARKLSPGDSLGSSMKSQHSPSSSTKRFRRLTRAVSPDDSDIGPHHKYYPSTASPSDTEGSINSSPTGSAIMVSRNTTYTMNSSPDQHYKQNGKRENYQNSLEKPTRPNFLDLCQGKPSAGTPVVSRKPCFQFTVAANSYELNNLDNDVLDAPTVYSMGGLNGDGSQFPTTSSDEYTTDPDSVILADSHGPVSMPQLTAKTQSTAFTHGQPVYQSAHPACSKDESSAKMNNDSSDKKQEGTKSLMKWKGIMFNPEEETAAKFDASEVHDEESLDGQILTVELNRGWNSRLGFSLQPDEKTGKTTISAIYSDSVAARDGRLREGDRVLMVNEESIEHMTTTEVIDLLRIIRGSICIKILRKNTDN